LRSGTAPSRGRTRFGVCDQVRIGNDLARSIRRFPGGPVDTRTIAILALIIAVIVILILVL
jgi:hypothetical protein